MADSPGPSIPTIDGKRPERVFYRALRNIMLNDWKISKESITRAIIDSLKIDAEKAFDKWLAGQGLYNYVYNTVRAAVSNMAAPIIREEIRAFLDRRVQLKLDASILPPEPPKAG